MQMDVRAGVGYGIVVDGFAGNFGTFEITVSATKVLSAALTASYPARPVLTRTLHPNRHCAPSVAVNLLIGAHFCLNLP